MSPAVECASEIEGGLLEGCSVGVDVVGEHVVGRGFVADISEASERGDLVRIVERSVALFKCGEGEIVACQGETRAFVVDGHERGLFAVEVGEIDGGEGTALFVGKELQKWSFRFVGADHHQLFMVS